MFVLCVLAASVGIATSRLLQNQQCLTVSYWAKITETDHKIDAQLSGQCLVKSGNLADQLSEPINKPAASKQGMQEEAVSTSYIQLAEPDICAASGGESELY